MVTFLFTHLIQNTYEALLITDGISSYAVYTYNCDTLGWGSPHNAERYSAVGYTINSEFTNDTLFQPYENYILSRYPRVIGVACINTQRGIPWNNLVYKVGESTDQLAPIECNRLIANDSGEVLEILERDDIRNCPCTSKKFQECYTLCKSHIHVFKGYSAKKEKDRVIGLDLVIARQFNK